MKMKILLLVLPLLLIPTLSFAQDNSNQANEEIFKSQIVEIIEQENATRDDGSISIHQKLKLRGLDGVWENKEIIFDGDVN